MPREVFIAGQILTAAEMNSVSDQTVMVFAGTAARGSAIPTPTEGMVTYLSDSNLVEAYTGAAFTPVATILQVVSTNYTGTFSTTSTTFTNVTDFEATITPISTSSNILVFVDTVIGFDTASGGREFFVQLNRDTTPIGNGTDGFFFASSQVASSGSNVYTGALSFLDSPNTTSATTYRVRAAVENSADTIFFNRAGQGPTTRRASSSITLMEVAG